MELVEMLTNFGLTRQEAGLYIGLLKEGEQNGYEAAKATGISRSNAYSGLASLVDKGAAYMVEGSVVKYIPVPPEQFCSNHIRRMKELKEQILAAAPKRREEPEGYITIKGADLILDKMREMIGGARERIYLAGDQPVIRQLEEELREAGRQGLKVVLLTDQEMDLPEAILYQRESRPGQIRLIVDSTYVLTGDIDGGKDSTCLYSRKKNLIDLIKDSLKNEIKLLEASSQKERII